MDVLPAIDIREGKAVRLLQGNYDQQIDYAHDPVGVAKQFEELGAKWLHIVDLDGALEGRIVNLPIIERILKETSLKVEVGGGLRTTEVIASLLETGASRCVVGTRALEDMAWFEEVVRQFPGKLALGLDAREGRLAVRGWKEETRDTALQIVERVADWPLAAIIYTDIGRDGMLLGPNIEAIKVIAEFSHVPVIASGGVTDINDVRELAKLPILGIIIGRAIYERQLYLPEALEVVAAA